MLSNRETVIAIILAAFLIAAVVRSSSLRTSLRQFLSQILQPKILRTFAIFSLIMALLIAGLLTIINSWQPQPVKTAIVWGITLGIPLLFETSKIRDGKALFKKKITQGVGLFAVLGFLLNLYEFSLWVEAVLVPIVIISSLIQFFPCSKENNYAADRLSSGVLTIIGISMVVYAVSNIISNPSTFFNKDNVVAFSIPIILTMSYLPFVLCFALYMRYKLLFTKIKIFWPDVNLNWKIRWQCLKMCSFQLKKIQSLQTVLVKEGIPGRDKAELFEVISNF